jgi:hypothetical protein
VQDITNSLLPAFQSIRLLKSIVNALKSETKVIC